MYFVEAVLGFEPEVIKMASDALHEAEVASSRDRTRAQKAGIATSSIYPPGTEYALTGAESNLMGAITLLLTESVFDTAKAFLKLRKAYQSLDELNRLIIERKSGGGVSSPSLSSGNIHKIRSTASVATLVSTAPTKSISEGQAVFNHEAYEKKLREKIAKFNLERAKRVNFDPTCSSETLITPEEEPEAIYQTMDQFIESGVYCMFGLLQLVISVIPPAVGKVLSVVGFKGSKEEGLAKLWAAVDAPNVHGAIALLALLQYFDGPTQFSDIALPNNETNGAASNSSRGTSVLSGDMSETSELTSDLNNNGDTTASSTNNNDSSHLTVGSDPLKPFPTGASKIYKQEEEALEAKRKLKEALATIRQRYTRGALWQLQEGRMVGATGDLARSVEIMDDTSNGPIEIKQVEGLMLYDKTMSMIVLHRFEESADNFLRLIDLNSWSHALYMYLAGSCYVEIYRINKESNPEKAAQAKKKANECIEKVPQMLGKRKVMARAMPFDIFVQRRVKLWKQISIQKKLDLIDSIGTSPIFEIIYIWNGFPKMPLDKLEVAMKYVGFSGKPGTLFASTNHPCLEESSDDFTTRMLLHGTILRCLGKFNDAVDLIETHGLPKIWTETPHKGYTKSGLPKVQYHKHLREPWAGPSLIYERGVLEWKMHGMQNIDSTRDYIDLAFNWDEDYELSTRIGFKIKSTKDKLDALD